MTYVLTQCKTTTGASHTKAGAFFSVFAWTGSKAPTPAPGQVIIDDLAGYLQLPDSPALARAKCLRCAKIGGWLFDPSDPTYTIDQARADQAVVLAAWSIAQVNAVKSDW